MFVVTLDRVGSMAFERLRRDHLIHDVLGGWGLPSDVPSTRAVRQYVIAPLLPAHAWLTGLAALWLEGWTAAPPLIDLAGPRGMHRTEPTPGSPPLRFHSGPLDGLPPHTRAPHTATPTRACLDALAHSPAATALPATASALRAGATSVPELMAGLARIDRHTAHRARVAGLVGLLAEL